MAANGTDPPTLDNLSINDQDSAVDSNNVIEEVEVDISKLHPLSPEVISKQATINIGEALPNSLFG